MNIEVTPKQLDQLVRAVTFYEKYLYDFARQSTVDRIATEVASGAAEYTDLRKYLETVFVKNVHVKHTGNSHE